MYRIFGIKDASLEPANLLEHLHEAGHQVIGHFRGDDLGWFRADLVYGGEAPIELERYLVREEKIRGEINSWAAWLETQSTQRARLQLMEHIISSFQLFTLRPPAEHVDDSLVQQLCWQTSGFLARRTDGVIQVDGQGFLDVEGNLLVADDERTAE